MTSRATGEFEASTLRVFAQRLGRIALLARPDGYCTYVNPAWTAFTGLDQEHSLGNGWQLALHPHDLTQALAEVTAGAHTQEPSNYAAVSGRRTMNHDVLRNLRADAR